MSIKFYSEGISFNLKNKTIIKEWVNKTIFKEKKEIGDINFIFCSDDFLVKMNKKYLKHNTFTDIITFDYTITELCGDIYISIERIKENSKKYSTGFDNEIYRVMIHGVLHLAGYKDKSKKDKEKMTEKENFYLKKLSKIFLIKNTILDE